MNLVIMVFIAIPGERLPKKMSNPILNLPPEDNEKCKDEPHIIDDDLEDGEIEDDDDDVDDANVGRAAAILPTTTQVQNSNNLTGTTRDDHEHQKIGSEGECTKPPQLLEDDFAGKLEDALTLKKKSIQPPKKKLLEASSDDSHRKNSPGDAGTEAVCAGLSKSGRRRSRMRKRDEHESKNKKHRFADARHSDDANIVVDDYEMLCVRGGSPPPPQQPMDLFMMQSSAQKNHHRHNKDDPDDDSYSSSGGYESADVSTDYQQKMSSYFNDKRRDSVGLLPPSLSLKGQRSPRRRRKRAERKSDRRNRRNYENDSEGEAIVDRYSGMDKRSREPRKLELCKFYLLECCAKKEKCSYMHSDFPCKYYYLGMECVYGAACKYSHGDPLTEQLRNVLLKHLETAPQEILGTFRRISRESAIALVKKRHLELCQEQGNMSQNQKPSDEIPSLLDMVIKPPTDDDLDTEAETTAKSNSTNMDRHRKSHRCGTSQKPLASAATNRCDLNNLTSVLNTETIEKLSELGIENLEQVNQLTFGQLNKMGLKISEITEIQMKALTMTNRGVVPVASGGRTKNETAAMTTTITPAIASPDRRRQTTTSLNETPTDTPKAASSTMKNSTTTTPNQLSAGSDVDMRFPLSCAPLSIGEEEKQMPPSDNHLTATSDQNASPQPAEAAVAATDGQAETVTNSGQPIDTTCPVDYSQYFKDSNLSYKRNVLIDDEKDEEQLIMALDEDDDDDAYDDDADTNGDDDEDDDEDSKKVISDFPMLRSDRRNPSCVETRNMHNTSSAATIMHFGGKSSKSCYEKGLPPTGTKSSDFPDYRLQYKAGHRTDEEASSGDDESYYDERGERHPREMRRSRTPSPDQLALYERPSMYDYNNHLDADERFDSANVDDEGLLLPFDAAAAAVSYTPATEIDGSIASHIPLTYKVYDCDVPKPNYSDLRQKFCSGNTADPRLRRILGLRELEQSTCTAALNKSRLASPLMTPAITFSSSSSHEDDSSPTAHFASSAYHHHHHRTDEDNVFVARPDPRKAAAANQQQSTVESQLHSATTTTATVQPSVVIQKLLQTSEWYKNLNSNIKIMVNQQMAQVSTELKRFHQDPSPNKVFDIQFIVKNQFLQQILTHLGVFIDENGEVVHVDCENEMGSSSNKNNNLHHLHHHHQPSHTMTSMMNNMSAYGSGCDYGGYVGFGNTAEQFLYDKYRMDCLRMAPQMRASSGGDNMEHHNHLIHPTSSRMGEYGRNMFSGGGPSMCGGFANRQPRPDARPSLLGLPPMDVLLNRFAGGDGGGVHPRQNTCRNQNFPFDGHHFAGNFTGGGGGPTRHMPITNRNNFKRNNNNTNRNKNQNRRNFNPKNQRKPRERHVVGENDTAEEEIQSNDDGGKELSNAN